MSEKDKLFKTIRYILIGFVILFLLMLAMQIAYSYIMVA